MSLIDRMISKITPQPADENLIAARAALRLSGTGVDWVELVCYHHDLIDEAFSAALGATGVEARRDALMQLAALLTGHSMAEEAVLYPAMALSNQRSSATTAFSQQSDAKVHVAELELLDPMSDDYATKLRRLQTAVAQHVLEEETAWLPDLLKNCDSAANVRLSARYRQEAGSYSIT